MKLKKRKKTTISAGFQEECLELLRTTQEKQDALTGQSAFLRQQVTQLYDTVANLWEVIQAQTIQNRDADRALREELRTELGKFQLDGPQRAMAGVFAKLFADLVGYVAELDELIEAASAEGATLDASWVESLFVSRAGLERILEDWGCTPISVDIGKEQFDPERHEASGESATSEEAAAVSENVIVRVERRGWLFHGDILRFPRVVVS